MSKIEKFVIRNGVLWGSISIVIHLLFYLMNAPMSEWQSLLIFVIGIYFMYDTGATMRKSLGGYITWKEAVKPIWLCSIIYCLFEFVYGYLLLNVIDPELVNDIKHSSIQLLEKYGGSMGEERLEQEIAKIENQDFGSLYSSFKGFMSMLLVYFGISAVMALVVRRKNPQWIFDKYSDQNTK